MPLDFQIPSTLTADATASEPVAAGSMRTAQPVDLVTVESSSTRPGHVPSAPVESLAAELADALEAHLQRQKRAVDVAPVPVLSAPPARMHPEAEWRGAFSELRLANASELSRTRHLLERRLDDMAQALHSDMRRLREECRAEWEICGRDVFRSATALSQAQDRIQRLEATVATLQKEMQAVFQHAGKDLPESGAELDRLHSPLTAAAPVPA